MPNGRASGQSSVLVTISLCQVVSPGGSSSVALKARLLAAVVWEGLFTVIIGAVVSRTMREKVSDHSPLTSSFRSWTL